MRPTPCQVSNKFLAVPIYLLASGDIARRWYIEKRCRDAFFAYLDRAEAGYPDAQAVTAFMYLIGYVETDDRLKSAIYWATKASESDYAYGRWVLGWALLVEFLLRRAAANNHLAAEVFLINVYRMGTYGVAKQVLAYFQSIIMPIKRLINLLSGNYSREMSLVYFRSIAFELEYRRDVKRELVSFERAICLAKNLEKLGS